MKLSNGAFKAFLDKNPDTAVVQMDSVIGSKGGKCLLTIHFVDSSLMLAYLRDANTSKSVTDIFEMLYNTLGGDLFKRLFPVILTDIKMVWGSLLVKMKCALFQMVMPSMIFLILSAPVSFRDLY